MTENGCKTCTKCGVPKPLDQFHRTKKSKDGRCHYCKECRKPLGREHYEDTRDEKLAYQKEYASKNKESVQARNKDWRKENRDRLLEEKKKHYLSNPDATWRSNLKNKYGITADEYHEMLTTQASGCAVCGHIPGPGEKRLCVDHDHETDAVRDLLCNWCNLSLGWAEEEPHRLRALAEYIEFHSLGTK